MIKKLFVLFSVVFVGAFASAETYAPLTESRLIAGVVEAEGMIQVFINSREVWDIDHTLTDSYSDEEMVMVDELTDKLNLCNLMESTYEPCKDGRTAESIRAELNAIGVEVNAEFEAWITKEVLGNLK